MPQAIAGAIVAAIGLTGTVATIATALITLAVTVGLNSIASAIFGGKSAGKPSDGQRVIRVAVGSRVRHYGKVRIAGQLTFYDSRGGTLYALITTGTGRIAAITEIQLNGKAVTVDGSGTVTSKSYSKKGVTRYPLAIFTRLGAPGETAYSQLTSAFAEWTAAHVQSGCSSLLLTAASVPSEVFSEVYEGSREPEPTITAETSLVYDPRKDGTCVIGTDEEGAPIYGTGAHRQNDPDTWEYSDNWALCFADYLAHEDGYGLGMEWINWANIAEEADVCDELLTTVDARSIKRWRVAGSYKLADDERRVVQKEFLKAGDGFLWQDANGLANIRCGRWIAPTVHIPAKHIIGCTASLGTDPQDRANEVRVIYMEPRFGHTETEAAALVDEPARLALGRSEVSRFDCYFCPDHNQAQRIGKRLLKKLGDRWSITLTANLYGLNAIGERFILISIPELAINAMAFEITSLKIDLRSLNVELGLIQVEEADFTFDAATEEGTPPGDDPTTYVPIIVEEMEGLALSAVQVTLGGSSGVGIQATWDDPIRLDLLAQVQYRATGATEWLEMTVSQDDLIGTSGIVSDAVEYEVRGRLYSFNGLASAWTAIETITPAITETAPAAPTELDVLGGTGEAILSWRNPASLNFGFVRVYRNTINNFGTATAIGDIPGGLSEVVSVVDDNGGTLAAGTYYWWAKSYNTGGTLFSSTAGPVTDAVS